MPVQLEFLKSIPYFSDLSPAELDSVGKFIFERTAERDELILLEGEPAEALYFVVSGAVKCFKTSVEGKEQILSIALPGDSFSDVPVFDGDPSPVGVQAMGSAVLYGIRKRDLEIILRDYPQVSLNVAKVLAGRVRKLVSLIEDLSFRHVINRVARILLEYAEDERGSKPRLTQREMAAMAGTAREIVGRSLKTLEEEGTIRLDRHRIVITDREALKEMVEAAS
jgi:CRP/FNR family transcriptional regulator